LGHWQLRFAKVNSGKLAMAELETYQPPLVRMGWLMGWLFKTGTLVKYKDAWFPAVQFPTAQQFDAIRNFPLDDSDILIASFPKSGCIFVSISHAH